MSDSSPLHTYQEKLQEAQKQLVDAEKALEAVQARLDRARSAFHAWHVIVEQEKERQGLPANRQTPSGGESQESESPGHNVNFVEWIFETVQSAGKQGIIAPEVYRKASAAGLKMHQNYPYTALKKLVERGRILKKDTRYYPKGATS